MKELGISFINHAHDIRHEIVPFTLKYVSNVSADGASLYGGTTANLLQRSYHQGNVDR